MANEIQEVVFLKASKSGLIVQSHDSTSSATNTYDLSGSSGAKWTQSFLHTADSAVVIPTDVGTANRLLIENLDTVNKVSLSTGTGGSFAGGKFSEIPAELPMLYKPNGTIYIQADTATVRLQFTALPA
jgi:hypothetical protein